MPYEKTSSRHTAPWTIMKINAFECLTWEKLWLFEYAPTCVPPSQKGNYSPGQRQLKRRGSFCIKLPWLPFRTQSLMWDASYLQKIATVHPQNYFLSARGYLQNQKFNTKHLQKSQFYIFVTQAIFRIFIWVLWGFLQNFKKEDWSKTNTIYLQKIMF